MRFVGMADGLGHASLSLRAASNVTLLQLARTTHFARGSVFEPLRQCGVSRLADRPFRRDAPPRGVRGPVPLERMLVAPIDERGLERRTDWPHLLWVAPGEALPALNAYRVLERIGSVWAARRSPSSR